MLYAKIINNYILLALYLFKIDFFIKSFISKAFSNASFNASFNSLFEFRISLGLERLVN
jgi:hypothetical protein